jgi:uncharacterized protein YecT (DUF1311 family)
MALSFQVSANKKKRFDAVECDVTKQTYGSVLECGDNLFSVKMGSAVEKSLYEICKINFKCKISFEINSRDEVTKILSAFSKGKKQAQTYPTSFNCKKPKTFVEKTICTNEDLANLDNQLGAKIKKKLETTDETKKVRDAQKKWLKEIRNICNSHDCLLKAYKLRLKEFDKR